MTGFTLIEILLVLAILALLTALLVPTLINVRRNAWNAHSTSCAHALINAEQLHRANTGTYATTTDFTPAMLRPCSDVEINSVPLPAGPAATGDRRITVIDDTYTFTVWHQRGSAAYTITSSPATFTRTATY